jgi:hypothetical protein
MFELEVQGRSGAKPNNGPRTLFVDALTSAAFTIMNHKLSWPRGSEKLVSEAVLFRLAVIASIAQLLDLWTTSRFPIEMEGNIYIRALVDNHGWSDPAAWLMMTAGKLYKLAMIFGLYLLAVARMKKGHYISIVALGFESNVNGVLVTHRQALARLMLGLGKAPKGRRLDFIAAVAPIFCFSIWSCSTYRAAWANYWAVEGRWDLVGNLSYIWPTLMEWAMIFPLIAIIIISLARKHNRLVVSALGI